MSANSHVLTWWVSGTQAEGLFIPTLRSFRIALPAAPQHQTRVYTGALALTSKQVYLIDGYGRLWSAKLPTSK